MKILILVLFVCVIHPLQPVEITGVCGSPTSSVDFQPSRTSKAIPFPSSSDIHEYSFSPSTVLLPILTNLGFQQLAMAVSSVADEYFAYTTWNGPYTLFVPADGSIWSSYSSSSSVNLLRQHFAPGIFTNEYLRKLAFGTKIETMDPGLCITVTSSTDAQNITKIFVDGVEITHPELFNNGLVVVHGLQGYVAPLSPFSCNIQRMRSLSFPSSQIDEYFPTYSVAMPFPSSPDIYDASSPSTVLDNRVVLVHGLQGHFGPPDPISCESFPKSVHRLAMEAGLELPTGPLINGRIGLVLLGLTGILILGLFGILKRSRHRHAVVRFCIGITFICSKCGQEFNSMDDWVHHRNTVGPFHY